MLASLALFTSLDVIVALLQQRPPWWAQVALTAGNALCARVLLGMSDLTEALTNQRESILHLHAQGIRLASDPSCSEQALLFRARLDLAQNYIALNRRGFSLGLGEVPPPHRLRTLLAVALLVLTASAARPAQPIPAAPAAPPVVACPECERDAL